MPSINSNPSPQDLLLAWAARPSSFYSPQEAYTKRKAKFRVIKFLNNIGMLSSRGVRYLLKIDFLTFSNKLNKRLQSSSISTAERSQLKEAYEKLAQKKWKVVKKDHAYSNRKFHAHAYQAYKIVMGVSDPEPKLQLEPKTMQPPIPAATPANSEPLGSRPVPTPPLVSPPESTPAPVHPVSTVVPPSVPHVLSTKPVPVKLEKAKNAKVIENKCEHLNASSEVKKKAKTAKPSVHEHESHQQREFKEEARTYLHRCSVAYPDMGQMLHLLIALSIINEDLKNPDPRFTSELMYLICFLKAGNKDFAAIQTMIVALASLLEMQAPRMKSRKRF